MSTNFVVTESGWYRTRDGRLAEVVVLPFPTPSPYPVQGYVLATDCTGAVVAHWLRDGTNGDTPRPYDLVEYLGKERPKEKKVVRMAPALLKTGSSLLYSHEVSFELYDSQEKAKEDYPGQFVRWLIDTPYEISVEVEHD